MTDQENILEFTKDLKQALGVLPPDPSPGYLYFPGSQEYKDSTNSYYWSSSKQSPGAVYFPRTVVGVQVFVQRLTWKSDKYPRTRVPFAIKAGSHIAPFGFNSTTEHGILVDMSPFKDIQYNKTNYTLDVGAGSTWVEVQEYLKQNNIQRNVVGATGCAGVGVAGFLLGGGYGNKANQFGLAMDNIVSMEIVTANGDILKASATNNPDLYWALMGGGNNFGIVTKWTLKTHPQSLRIFHDTIPYPGEESFPAVQAAVLAFAGKVDNYRKADVATKYEWTVDDKGKLSASAFAVLFYDDDPDNIPEGLFDDFYKIPGKLNNKILSYNTFDDLMRNLPGKRQTFRWGVIEGVDDLPEDFRGRYTVVMVSGYTKKLIQKVIDVAKAAVPLLLDHSGLQLYPVISPASSHIFDNSPDAAWPHKKGSPNMMLPIKCIWTNPADDAFWLAKLREMSNEIWRFAISEGCSSDNTPFYYNLSLDGTKVEDVYRGNLPKLSELRRKYDRDGLMDHTGGFRV